MDVSIESKAISILENYDGPNNYIQELKRKSVLNKKNTVKIGSYQTSFERVSDKISMDDITDEEFNDMIASGQITTTDEDYNPCAATGLKPSKFQKGGKWEVIKEFKGKSHAQGGIDIEIGNGSIKMSNKQDKFEAKFGLVIPKNNSL